jgi:hypothetical protein
MITRRGLISVGLGVLAARAAAQTPNLPLVGALFISDPVLSYTWKRLVADTRGSERRRRHRLACRAASLV